MFIMFQIFMKLINIKTIISKKLPNKNLLQTELSFMRHYCKVQYMQDVNEFIAWKDSTMNSEKIHIIKNLLDQFSKVNNSFN